MSETDTPRTAEQLVDELETCAFLCGDYSNSVSASQARIAKHEAALRKAKKDVTERITTLERELAAMTARAELAERQVAVLCNNSKIMAYNEGAEDASCLFCQARIQMCDDDICEARLAAWSRAEAEKGGSGKA
jgi:hypothetical protein